MTKETNTQINVVASTSKGVFHENDNTHLNVYTTLCRASSTSNLASKDASYEENTHPNTYPILRRSSSTSNLTPNDPNTFLGLPGEPSHLSKSGSCISFKRLSTVALNLFSLQKKLGELKNKATADSNNKTLLHYAAESGNGKLLEEAINTLCNSGCNIKEEVNGKDKSGKTPLHYAAKSGNEECFRLLRREGARFADTINFKSELHYTARSGNVELLTHLQKTEKFKEALSKEDKYGNNALHYAAQSGDKETIQFFIEHCVQFISNQYSENPLHKIASIVRPLAEPVSDEKFLGESQMSTAEYSNVFEERNQVSTTKLPSETGLCKRSINASKDAIDLLIENLTTSGRLKDEVMHKDENGDTPLHIAARYGNIMAIGAFKEAGADINSKNNKGNTPLHMAIIYGHSDCINLFFENNQSEVKGQHSRDPIHLAAMYGRANSLKKLFKKCADYDVGKEVDDQGNTALHLAMSDDIKSAMLNHTEIANRKKIIELLINKGAEINKENNNGDTFLHLVARYGNKELFTFAIDKHNINLDEEICRKNNIGDTIFHMAARAGDKELLEYLFDHKKLSTKENRSSKKDENRNKTLLHLAAKSGNTECVEFIIKKIKENNNEFELSTMSGSDQRNLLFLAAVSGNEECFEFFFDHFEALENYSVLIDHGINNNTILHKAALSGNLDCFQYICNKIVSTMQENGFAYGIDDLFVQNNNGLTPLHLATMYFNADIIEHITASKKGESNNRPLSKPIYDQKFLGEVQASTAEYSNVFKERSSASTTKLPLEIELRKRSNYFFYTSLNELLNSQSKSGSTPLHYLVMNDNDFDIIHDEILKSTILEKRKKNQHLRERAINALLFKTKQDGEKVVNEGINFDIKDHQGKTILDYALNGNIDTMRLFLEAFNEKREKSEEKYKAFKTKYQVWIKYFGRATSILAPLASIVITVCILANISGSVKIGFSIVSISCAMIAICLTIFTTYVSCKKRQLKNDQQNYEDKIKIIEEKMGISGRHKMFYNLEEYGALQRQVRENTKLTSINKKLGEEIEKLSKENARRIKENKKLVEANQKQIKENTEIVDINKEQIGKNTELTSTNKSLVEKNKEIIEENKGKILDLENQISRLERMLQDHTSTPLRDIQTASRRGTKVSLYSNNRETEQLSNDNSRLAVQYERRESVSGAGLTHRKFSIAPTDSNGQSKPNFLKRILNHKSNKESVTTKPKATKQPVLSSLPPSLQSSPVKVPKTSFSLHAPRNSTAPACSQSARSAYKIDLPIIIISAEAKEDDIRSRTSSGTLLRVNIPKSIQEEKKESVRPRTKSDPSSFFVRKYCTNNTSVNR